MKTLLFFLFISQIVFSYAQNDTIPPHLKRAANSCILLGSVWQDQTEFEDNQTPESLLIIEKKWQSGPINTLKSGIYYIIYTVSDENSNQFIYHYQYYVVSMDDCNSCALKYSEDTICHRIGDNYVSTIKDKYSKYKNLNVVIENSNVDPYNEGFYEENYALICPKRDTIRCKRVVQVTFCGKLHAYIQIKEGFILKPNPANHYIQIILSGYQSKGTLKIFDLSGKEVLFENLYDQASDVDISNLPPDVYVVLVQSDLGFFSKNLIVYR